MSQSHFQLPKENKLCNCHCHKSENDLPKDVNLSGWTFLRAEINDAVDLWHPHVSTPVVSHIGHGPK